MKSSDSAEDLFSAYNTTCGATSPRWCYETDNFIRRYDGRLVYDADHEEIYPEYHHRDHLGNTRLAFTDRNEDQLVEIIGNGNEVTQVLDFYPFGLAQMSTVVAAGESSNRYRYNGKEFSEEIGLYDYGFRYYDPSIGRFTGVDPIASDFPWVSTYNYAENEPVRHIELHGLQMYDPQTGQTGPFNPDYIQDQERAEIRKQLQRTTVTEDLGSASAESDAEMMMAVFSPENVGMILMMAEEGVGLILKTGGTALKGMTSKMASEGSEKALLYRGVNESSPAFDDAAKGIVNPRGGKRGHLDAIKHNTGANNSR